ncbi:MAG: hypothetical protein A3J48_00675 [Candidatus Doudnabacteria bacterium RIFCSPHIGHO2_02_FULL_46_11]|uniref:Histidine ammonia-lyase n=1 Tax=Candidatus Doudnabacteria bacterium RIFCSPHIGHO2_02_FULL_46_11 TaxID=1817832 RepID=A0A1F5P519_9BACT|nr:MAG: hypothetical protein A3J48_00675 [Candidatus Doudnabacteria bacterium RIFCSPHIGHO2_02_FULL_46_11]
MAKNNVLVLDGENLSIQDIELFVRDPGLVAAISRQALTRVGKSSAFVAEHAKKHIIYGVNTGFGPMASYILNAGQLVELQKNLIYSHAVGMGEPINPDFVLAAMLVRLNTLSRGYSGTSPQLLESLKNIINARIIPVVPEHGAVGTSGDLVQLAHIALVLLGKGLVTFKGKTMNAEVALKQAKLKPYKLKLKEGLSLINGTAVMTGVGAFVSLQADHLLALSVRSGAIALELARAYDDSISDKLHSLRPHPGQQYIARELRRILQSSKLLRKREQLHDNFKEETDVYVIPETVQEVYSFRCIAQILGPIYETAKRTHRVIEVEMNSVTDNPIVDLSTRHILHGGNFHGDYISAEMDKLKMNMVKLTMLAERRINFFLNPNVNKTYPPFLNLKKPGLTLALQGLQFVATSTTAQSQTLAYPQYVHSIPTNGDNQDIVSMGTDSALLAAKVLENAYIVVTIELLCLAQAIDLLQIESKLSRESKRLYQAIRKSFPPIYEDRILSDELSKVLQTIKEYRV